VPYQRLAAAVLTSPESIPMPPHLESPTVLVVDDESHVRQLLNLTLRRYGFNVLLAASGREALEVYRRHREAIAGVLLDVRMPGLSGVETLAALQQLDPQVRCCLTTGAADRCGEEGWLERGAVAVLPKPFALADLAEALGRAVGHQPTVTA
jgi:two-component system, cell cycle sensor histidine kinase and response regulator CckA